MLFISGKKADFPGWKMMTFHAREGRKGHAYANKGDPGALPGLLRRAKGRSAALPLSKMPALAVQDGAQAQGWGKPLQSRPETEKLLASPHILGNAGRWVKAPRLWTHPEAIKGRLYKRQKT